MTSDKFIWCDTDELICPHCGHHYKIDHTEAFGDTDEMEFDDKDTIMHAIHVAAVRIADKYERQLMTEVVNRIQIQMEASEEAKKSAGNYINEKLNDLSKE